MSISAKTVSDLGWPQLIEHLARRTHTARGEQRARELDFCERDVAEARIAEISEARELFALDATMPFGGVRDITSFLARVDKGGVLGSGELIAVADTARGLARLARHLRHHADEAPRLAEIASEIIDLRHLYQRLSDCFDDNGQLADHASDQLGPLRKKLSNLRAQLDRRMRTFIDDSDVSRHLQDRYYTTRDERYVIPVRVDARSQVRGIVHGTSQSGQTVFVEPQEIVELGNRVRLAECAVEDEELRILTALSREVEAHTGELHAGLEASIRLDVIDAGAALAEALRASAPAISEDRRLSLKRARHPLMVLWDRACVANDIVMEPGTVLIVTGPNAGGKTVAMEVTGLCALMLRAGLHIPADPGSTLPFFRDVHSDIGDSQSLENELSTFSAHLVKLRTFLDMADETTLLLIDEICAGTEPEQGASLAQAVLETLADRGVAAMVTTHYEKLKALGASDARFANASVGFDLDAMEPTFRLHMGIPGSSAALYVARRMGLGERVLARAHELLGERRASIEELLAEVAEERRKLAEERAELASVRAEADRALARAEVARNSAKEYEHKLKQGAHGEAVAALRRARVELDRLRSAVKKRPKKEDVAATKKRISELASAIAEHAPQKPKPAGEQASADNIQPGAQVYVTSLGSRGEVVEATGRGKVTVQIGKMKTAVPLSELVVQGQGPERPARKAPDKPKKSTHASKQRRTKQIELERAEEDGLAGARTPDCTLDVRGERAEEAVDAVDRFIDRSLMAARDVIFVIHGHGTGALRTAIRGHFESHSSVSNWRPGVRSEGGNGVTIAWLDVD